MSKFIVALALFAMVACAAAQVIPISGTRDLTGGYYDHYTGQYSSAITGRVYNTAPAVAIAAGPAIAASPYLAAPAIAHHAIAAPAIVGAPAIAAAAPLGWIRK